MYRILGFPLNGKAANTIECVCAFCGKVSIRYQSQPIKYCSHACRNKGRDISIEDRFWGKVQKTESCWLWTGCKHRKGYGKLHYQGVLTYVHRFSYELHYGSIPEGLDVLHECDNPPCVNPAHLKAGTHQDNMTDLSKRGRAPRLFSEDEIREIRMLARSVSARSIARKRGVSPDTINRILLRETYRHVA